MNRKPSLASLGANAPRAAEIIAALVSFGFTEFVQQTGLAGLIPGGSSNRAAGDTAGKSLPERVRLLLIKLGTTWIKAGQIASTRPDLVPSDWIDELKKLQSDVPTEPWDGEDGIKSVLTAEYGDRFDSIFASVEEAPLAAASIAQVHRGELSTGESVVLKVLKPGVRTIVESDLELMAYFAALGSEYFASLGFDAEAVVDEFGRQLRRETDLTIEARSAIRMRTDFADHEGVTFPEVYQQHSTPSVLVMEEVEGTLLNKLDLDTLSPGQREAIVRNGADAVFRQCLKVGFFHADPHPGNIFVLDEGRLCFIDCGMTGHIDPNSQHQIAEIVHGTTEADLGRVVRTAIQIGGGDSALNDNRAFRQGAWRIIERFQGGTLATIQVGRLPDEFFGLLRAHHLHCPADIVYLIKALTTIEGVAQSIAPDFDLVAYVHPYVERLVKRRYGIRALKRRFIRSTVAYGDLLEDVPALVGDIMRNVRRNDVSLHLEHQGLDRLTRELERASMNISWALVIAGLIVGAAMLVLADSADGETSALTTIAMWGFLFTLLLGMGRAVWSFWKKG